MILTRCEVLTAIKIYVVTLWVVRLCTLVAVYRLHGAVKFGTGSWLLRNVDNHLQQRIVSSRMETVLAVRSAAI